MKKIPITDEKIEELNFVKNKIIYSPSSNFLWIIKDFEIIEEDIEVGFFKKRLVKQKYLTKFIFSKYIDSENCFYDCQSHDNILHIVASVNFYKQRQSWEYLKKQIIACGFDIIIKKEFINELLN